MRRDLYSDIYKQERKHWWHLAKKKLVKELLKNHFLGERPKILDVGCGTGMIIESLGEIAEMWGVDKENEAIKICKKRGVKNVLKGSAENLPFKEGVFDVITALDVLEHTNDEKSLREFYRVLKPKGKLILTVPAYPWMWSKWDEVLGHKRRYTERDLIEILNKNGFRIIKSSYLYSFLLLPAYAIRKVKEKFSNEYSSDFLLSNRLMNKMLGILADMERVYFLKKKIPFGLSLIAVAERRASE